MIRQRSAQQTLQRLLTFMVVAVVICALVGTVVGSYFAGTAGLWSGLTAGVIGLLMVAITAFTHSKCLQHKDYLMAWMGMDFLGKFVLLGGSLFAVKRLTEWEPKTLGITLIVILIVTSFAGMYAVMTANLTLLDKTDNDE